MISIIFLHFIFFILSFTIHFHSKSINAYLYDKLKSFNSDNNDNNIRKKSRNNFKILVINKISNGFFFFYY